MSHLLVRPLLHANVDPWMPDQVGHDDLERLPSLDCHSICEPCQPFHGVAPILTILGLYVKFCFGGKFVLWTCDPSQLMECFRSGIIP